MIRTLPALFALLFAAPLMAAPVGQQTLFNFVRPTDVVKVATQDASLPQYNAEQTPEGEVLRRITFNPAAEPSLVLSPQTGTWDWSQSSAMSLRIQSAMDWALTLYVKVQSNDGKTLLSRIDLPAAFADDAGVVLDTRVAAHEADDLTRLEFPGGAIFVSHRPEAIGTALRCRIHARDVSLALVPQTQSSILNCVAATVIDLAPTDTPGHVLVRLDAEGTPLLARITQRSAARLDIRSGLAVHAQIKAVALLA